MTAAPACRDTVTELSADEAWAVLEPYFAAERDLFVAAGFTKCRRTQLYCAPWAHDAPRHFAACRDDGSAIIVAPEMAELGEDTVMAILAHELGHATDFLYPGQWALGPERAALKRERDGFTGDQWAAWMRSWQDRDDDTVEFMADALVELATGHRIGYLGPCQLQAFDRGKARPQGLR